MTGMALRNARKDASLSQSQAAGALRVTQAYLSMMERGARPVGSEVAARAMTVFPFPATALPLEIYRKLHHDDLWFKAALGTLGYRGFAYLADGIVPNPAQVLLAALDEDDLDARVTEALPWVVLTFSGLDWDWLRDNAKMQDRQNRLAYVTTVASEMAKLRDDLALSAILAQRAHVLRRSRLAADDTLCSNGMTGAERRWLREHRPEEAAYWNLLTDLRADHLDYSLA